MNLKTIAPVVVLAAALTGCGASAPAKAKSTPTPPSLTLTGFGATTASWSAHHQADPKYAAGSAYDPTPGLGSPNDRYYAVNVLGGHIASYSERFAAGTSLTSAKAQALRELPSDAHVLWSATKDTCTQMGVTSARLGAALGAGGNGVLVEFTSDAGAYNAGADPSASFSEGDVSTSQAAGGC